MATKKKSKNLKGNMSEVNPLKVQTFLAGMDYPAIKDDIIDYADSREASEDVLDILKEVPDREYENPADLMKEVGKII
jgi:hypothetical protein